VLEFRAPPCSVWTALARRQLYDSIRAFRVWGIAPGADGGAHRVRRLLPTPSGSSWDRHHADQPWNTRAARPPTEFGPLTLSPGWERSEFGTCCRRSFRNVTATWSRWIWHWHPCTQRPSNPPAATRTRHFAGVVDEVRASSKSPRAGHPTPAASTSSNPARRHRVPRLSGNLSRTLPFRSLRTLVILA